MFYIFKNLIKFYIIFCITIFNFTIIYANSDDDITKYDILLDEGKVMNNTDIPIPTYILNKENGDSVNFYVENNGSSPITIRINDIANKTLNPKESGYISAPITSKNQEFKFWATLGENGGTYNIKYIIKQKNNIKKSDLAVKEGKIKEGEFYNKLMLNKENGDSVNFYVENNGSSLVIISINDKTNKILKAGEKGHISSKITSKNEQFEFKVQSYKNTDNINITHIIKQRR